MFRNKGALILLACILLVAAVLRFWNFFALTFTFDELNAMERAVFPGFSELISKGVKVDAHPSLIQVFLWLWQKLAGDSEAAIKFPFIIMGLASVWLSFLVASKFFNQTVGFMVASLIAGLSFTVMYSQIARPYISGMFFALGLVNALLNFSKGNKFKYLASIFIFAELCLYNHHFSGCFAAMACLGAFSFIPRSYYQNFLLCGLAVVIGYLPEVPITYFQMHVVSTMGGLQGIATPGNNYLLKFFACVLNFSRLMYILAIVTCVVSLFLMFPQKEKRVSLFRFYCLLLFLLPYLIGFVYSRNVSQVLQNSTLIFGLPFLFMAALSGIPELAMKKNIGLSACILALCVYNLVHTRRHYSYFYRQPFDSMYQTAMHLQDSLQQGRTAIYMNIEPYVHYYYHKKYDRDLITLPRKEKLDPAFFRAILDTLGADYLILANPYDEYVNMARDKYPYLIHRRFGYSLNLYCYSRRPEHAALKENFSYVSEFSRRNPWQSGDWQTGPDQSGQLAVTYIPADEYGLVFCDTLRKISSNYSDKLNFTFDIETEGKNEPLVCFEASENGKKALWRGYDAALCKLPAGQKRKLSFSLNMEDLLENMSPDAVIRFYVWNNKKSKFRLSNIRFFVSDFNKNLFRMFEPLRQ